MLGKRQDAVLSTRPNKLCQCLSYHVPTTARTAIWLISIFRNRTWRGLPGLPSAVLHGVFQCKPFLWVDPEQFSNYLLHVLQLIRHLKINKVVIRLHIGAKLPPKRFIIASYSLIKNPAHSPAILPAPVHDFPILVSLADASNLWGMIVIGAFWFHRDLVRIPCKTQPQTAIAIPDCAQICDHKAILSSRTTNENIVSLYVAVDEFVTVQVMYPCDEVST